MEKGILGNCQNYVVIFTAGLIRQSPAQPEARFNSLKLTHVMLKKIKDAYSPVRYERPSLLVKTSKANPA